MQSTALTNIVANIKAASIVYDDKTPTDKFFHESISFLFANDSYREAKVGDILKSTTKRPGQLNYGVVIGEAHLLSYLPELSTMLDLLVLCDINPAQHRHMAMLLQLLVASATPAEFRGAYTKRLEELKLASSDVIALTGLLDHSEKLIEPGYFFLSSPERYLACKAGFSRITLAPYQADFMDVGSVKKLMSIIQAEHKAECRLVNVTNLKEYDKEGKWERLQSSLNTITQPDTDTIVLYSDLDYGNTSKGDASFYRTCRATHLRVSEWKITQHAMWNTPNGVLQTSYDPMQRIQALAALMSQAPINDFGVPDMRVVLGNMMAFSMGFDSSSALSHDTLPSVSQMALLQMQALMGDEGGEDAKDDASLSSAAGATSGDNFAEPSSEIAATKNDDNSAVASSDAKDAKKQPALFHRFAPVFPSLLSRFKVRPDKVTAPAVERALEKISQEAKWGPGIANGIAKQFIAWSHYHGRQFNLQSIKKFITTGSVVPARSIVHGQGNKKAR